METMKDKIQRISRILFTPTTIVTGTIGGHETGKVLAKTVSPESALQKGLPGTGAVIGALLGYTIGSYTEGKLSRHIQAVRIDQPDTLVHVQGLDLRLLQAVDHGDRTAAKVPHANTWIWIDNQQPVEPEYIPELENLLAIALNGQTT